jgi:hypothetical protein
MAERAGFPAVLFTIQPGGFRKIVRTAIPIPSARRLRTSRSIWMASARISDSKIAHMLNQSKTEGQKQLPLSDARPSSALRIVAVSALVVISGVWESGKLAWLADGDIWWHLRAGSWILEHHAVPRTALFSQHAALPWIDTSWGFDTLIAIGYRALGLLGIPLLVMFLWASLAAITFLLARSLRARFWWAVALSPVALIGLGSVGLRPAILSILLFGIELLLLFSARRTGDLRALYWLPLLFLIWANVDEQFVYGLLVLAIFLVATISKLGDHGLALSRVKLVAVTGATLTATLVSPYTFHSYEMFSTDGYGAVTFSQLPELHAMNFRQPQHYLILLLVCAAFLALGRKRQHCDLFQAGTVLVCAALAFHHQLEAWVVVLPAVAVLAGAFTSGEAIRKVEIGPGWKLEALLVAAITTVALFVAVWARTPGNDELIRRAGVRFPVKACDYIRLNHLSPPLFNTYSWGGFLTWYLPEYPVAIDGRMKMYGSDLNELHFKVTNGLQPLDTEPAFTGANTFLLERHSALAEALRSIPGYEVRYSDNVAAVLSRMP